MNTAVIINPYCHGGRGWKRWLDVRAEVHKRMAVPAVEVVMEKGGQMEESLRSLPDVAAGTLLISAGGDGTIHYLVNHLLTHKTACLQNITVGAVGLGSSNDFLKPFGEKIRGVPVRINHQGGTLLHDIGVANYTCNGAGELRKYFIVNASLGVTAEANWNFNHPDQFLKVCKKHLTSVAISYTAISSILKHRNTKGTLSFLDKTLETAIANINILKVPFVSGSFYYDQEITRDDGSLILNACLNMSRWELLAILGQLQKGSFPGSAKTVSASITAFRLTAAKPFIFECDGETDKADSISISVIPNALKVLKS